MIRKAKAVWRGTGRDGDGDLSTDFGVLHEHAVFVSDPIREREGHQSRGADRRRPRRLLHDGARVSFRKLPALTRPSSARRRRCHSRTGGQRVQDQPFSLDAARQGAQPRGS